MTVVNGSTIKNELINLISNLEFDDGIPNANSLPQPSLKLISSFFNRDLITPEVISSVIFDRTFNISLEPNHLNEGDNKIIKFSQYPNVKIDLLADQIFSFLSELPAGYIFLLKLPDSSNKISDTKLNENIEFYSLTEVERQKYFGPEKKDPLISGVNYQPDEDNKHFRLKNNDVVLKITCYGYVAEYGLIKAYMSDPLYLMKAIVGLYSALGVISKKENYNYFQTPKIYKYIATDIKTNKIIRTFDESTNDETFINKMCFKEKAFELNDKEESINKFMNMTEIIKKIFIEKNKLLKEHESESIKFQLILKNTAYWYYESLKIQEDHIKSIFITTAFDSLLGGIENEKDMPKETKSEIISNIIAKDGLEAITIKTYIKKLYSLRNDIVHGKKSISVLEKYSEESNSDFITSTCMFYLSRLFANRIYFYTGSIKTVDS